MLKVSVVTISYNQVEFLQECIDSVVNQDYPNIEYIIVDPGSTDGSRELIKKNKDKFTHIIFEPDNGPADGLNNGFAKATGDIYYFLNSDDIVLENVFSQVVKKFEKDSKMDILIGNGYKIDAMGDIFKNVVSDSFSPKAYVYNALNFIQQSVFFRSSAFHAINGFNSQNRINWDGELLVDFALHSLKFSNVNAYYSKFRWYDNSISGSGAFSEKYKKEKDRLFKKVMGRNRKAIDKIIRYIYLLRKYTLKPQKIILKVSK